MKVKVRSLVLRIIRTAEAEEKNRMSLSPADYERLVIAGEINLNGELKGMRNIVLKKDGSLKEGMIRTNSVTLN